MIVLLEIYNLLAFKSVRGEKKDVFREALPRFRRENPKFPQEPACGTLPGLREARLSALYINPLFFRQDNVEIGDIQFLHVERGLVLEHPLPEQPLHDRRDEKLREPLERRVRVLMRGEAQVLPGAARGSGATSRGRTARRAWGCAALLPTPA